MKSDEIICINCNKAIDKKKETYVLLGTYNKGKTRDESYFHFNCWRDYFNERIMQRIQKGQEMALGLVGNALKGMNVKLKNG